MLHITPSGTCSFKILHKLLCYCLITDYLHEQYTEQDLCVCVCLVVVVVFGLVCLLLFWLVLLFDCLFLSSKLIFVE